MGTVSDTYFHFILPDTRFFNLACLGWFLSTSERSDNIVLLPSPYILDFVQAPT